MIHAMLKRDVCNLVNIYIIDRVGNNSNSGVVQNIRNPKMGIIVK